ncbi:hydroxymethylbilane synthase [Pampinifervens florentissimum]|uniref:hydroxymethylbilane synthase n=1 Tax=Pampinifervens florentissimum TaxID=1632019 RepID=UPI0013B48E9D|nr:hydroxymethylbilane synthase [Hydrogenobacter sp. T-8]QID33233.1 hydroxymethylbilane synthase [Hydrogenobacter sp. T-8]
MSKNTLRIGTRKSKLALWQANYVKERLEGRGYSVELVLITTTGDKILDAPLAKIGGKGLFVKEIEEALLRGDIDLAVHSLKDVPMVLPEGLTLGAITEREEPFDVLISRDGRGFQELPEGAKVGTSSLRRQVQIKRKRPDLRVEPLRGNVDTRLRKLEEGLYDAIVLAYAGVKRMGFEERVSEVLEDFIPAVGQGSLAIEIRQEDQRVYEAIAFLDHRESRIRAECERAFLRELQGGCQVPIGAYAWIESEKLKLKAFISDLEGRKFLEGIEEGDLHQAEQVGKKLARRLLEEGGKEILEEIYHQS